MLLAGILFSGPASAQSPDKGVAHLEQRGHAVQLMVDNTPLLMLAGELHNSSASSLAYMDARWSRLEQAELNTVLAPVYWELLEPSEGDFNFDLVDGLLSQARAHHMHLVLLWFGSWKNGQSTYAPAWVKRDTARFPLVEIAGHLHLQVLSPFSDATLQADSTAFSALMGHLKQVDGTNHTVVMVQVENEVGVLGDTRDKSQLAEKAMAGPVPDQLLRYLRSHRNSLRPALETRWKQNGSRMRGNWQQVFGSGPATDELLMAWQYARFIDRIAQGGKSVYPIPLYVNAWIVQPDDKQPGDYPSGGPQAHVHDIWKAAAPHIDILAPDIYLPDFAGVCDEYREPGRAFFVPESRGSAKGAANALYAFGTEKAIGYSPFGIDDSLSSKTDTLGNLYRLLGGMAPLILTAQQQGQIAAAMVGAGHPQDTFSLGGYRLVVSPSHRWNTRGPAPLGYALIVSTGPGAYYAVGANFQLTFFPEQHGGTAGLEAVQEGRFVEGTWHGGRWLNGDETATSIQLGDMAREHKTGMAPRIGPDASILRIKVYTF